MKVDFCWMFVIRLSLILLSLGFPLSNTELHLRTTDSDRSIHVIHNSDIALPLLKNFRELLLTKGRKSNFSRLTWTSVFYQLLEWPYENSNHHMSHWLKVFVRVPLPTRLNLCPIAWQSSLGMISNIEQLVLGIQSMSLRHAFSWLPLPTSSFHPPIAFPGIFILKDSAQIICELEDKQRTQIHFCIWICIDHL